MAAPTILIGQLKARSKGYSRSCSLSHHTLQPVAPCEAMADATVATDVCTGRLSPVPSAAAAFRPPEWYKFT